MTDSVRAPASDRHGWVVAAGFALAFAVMAAAVFFSYRATRRFILVSQRVAHTHEVLAALDASLETVGALESSSQEYIASAEARSLDRYAEAAERIHENIGVVRKLTADNPAQQARLPPLEASVDGWIAISGRSIALRKETGLEAALTFIGEGYGQRAIDDIRRRLREMKDEEGRLLGQRTLDERSRSRDTLIFFSVGGAVQFSFLFVVYFLMSREIRKRQRAAHDLAERTRLAIFGADVGAALTRRENLDDALHDCAEAMVTHLGGSTASIWTLNAREQVLELRGSAGFGTTRPDFVDRVALGRYRLGRIAQDGKPQLVLLASAAAEEEDRNWARNQGMVSFAGYPLVVRDRVVGVMAMFAARRLTEATVSAMGSVADEIALGIDRARAAEELRDSEAETRAVIENMIEGLIIVDAASVVREVNPAAERIFGFTRLELIGQPLARLLPEGPSVDAADFLRETRRRVMGRVTEWEARRKSGEIFPLELSLFEFHSPEGRMFGGSVRDVSERREVDRLKSEFISTVSHELRTPLTSIRGSLGLISGGVAGEIPPQARALVDIAYKNSERLSRLVNDILDMEKIESGRLEFRLERLEAGQLIESVLEANQGYAKQYGVSLELTRQTPEGYVHGDRDRLVQVLTNLVSNAVKFSPKDAAVTVTLSKGGGRVRISVSDRGPGIPEEFRSRIFQRFRQADSLDTRQKGGTGLGLAIAKSIVERLGGEISFESQVGVGTSFHVDLPERSMPMQASEVAAVAGAFPVPRARILICEDDLDQASLLSLILQSTGFQTEVARDAEEAKALLAQRPFDAMTLDIILPGQDGISLIQELRADEKTRHLPIVVVALDAETNRAGMIGDAFGIIDWLGKPVDRARLLSAIQAVAGRQPGSRPRVLHVEDDPDVVTLLKALLRDRAEIVAARTCREAESALKEGAFDLLVLDVGLPDGSGLSLLPLLHRPGRPPVPVVVLSAHELSRDMARAIEAALVKSQTSNDEILRTIESLAKLPQPGVA